jgi:hypothetical protein
LDKCRLVSRVFLVGAVLVVVSYTSIFFVASPANQIYTLAKEHDVDTYDDKLIQITDFTSNEAGTTKIVPLSSGNSESSSSSGSDSNSYGYSGSKGISVQQNVTQQNVCSSNTAYCYNEVDNDFNVNPP